MDRKNTKRRDEFREFISSCLLDRLNELGAELSEDKLYTQFIKEQSELFHRIREAIPEILLADFLRYEDTFGSIEALEENFYYICGFRDCVYLFMMLLWDFRRQDMRNV